MCGIAGIYYFRHGEIPPDSYGKMAKALAHRGPDKEGFSVHSNVALVHRRLKIIDLSEKASQPMKDENARFSLIYNGEIYNFKELRKGLESRFSFFSQSDTEVILRLFQLHREKTWGLLNGMFALAIYDSQTEELFLARDHAGVKPLYCYQDAEKFLFASELKGLLSSGLIQPDIDLAAVGNYLRFGYFPRTSTPYRGVYKLLPGAWARIYGGKVEIAPYWKIRDFQSPEPPSAPESELSNLLIDSVRNQMISDVPLGAFLSGGIDSSFIVALMSQLSSEPVKTFTVGFSGLGYYDERPYAARVASHFKTEHHDTLIENRLEGLLLQVGAIFDEPFADPSSVPTYALAKMAREYVTVALSGTGGDEIFGGYRKYMAAHWLPAYDALPSSLRAGFEKAAGLLPGSRKGLWRERALLLQRFSRLPNGSSPALRLNLIFSDEEIQELLGVPATALPDHPAGNSLAEELMLWDYENYLPEDLLVKEDRCTMAFGLEARVPFLDRKVIEFMSSLPISYKVTAASTKRLFKRVAKQYLPSWVLKRPKHGFGSPIAEWLRSDLRSLTEDLLYSSQRLLTDPMIREKIETHMRGTADHSRKIWPLLMLELWNQNRG